MQNKRLTTKEKLEKIEERIDALTLITSKYINIIEKFVDEHDELRKEIVKMHKEIQSLSVIINMINVQDNYSTKRYWTYSDDKTEVK